MDSTKNTYTIKENYKHSQTPGSEYGTWDGELGCLCGKAGTSHLCDGSTHSSGCMVNGPNAMAAV